MPTIWPARPQLLAVGAAQKPGTACRTAVRARARAPPRTGGSSTRVTTECDRDKDQVRPPQSDPRPLRSSPHPASRVQTAGRARRGAGAVPAPACAEVPATPWAAHTPAAAADADARAATSGGAAESQTVHSGGRMARRRTGRAATRRWGTNGACPVGNVVSGGSSPTRDARHHSDCLN